MKTKRSSLIRDYLFAFFGQFGWISMAHQQVDSILEVL